MQIRKSTPEDLAQMMELYAKARVFMRENGNPNQWGDSHPAQEIIEADIAAGKSYVCTEGEEIISTFISLWKRMRLTTSSSRAHGFAAGLTA